MQLLPTIKTLVALCLLAACARPKETKAPESHTQGPKIIFRGSKPDAERVFQRSRLDCTSDNGICPENVGLLVMIYAMEIEPNVKVWVVGACTASLAAENLLLTNSHCIPDDIKDRSTQDACSERMHFVNHKAVKLKCAEIQDFTETSNQGLGIDFALVKLQPGKEKITPLPSTPFNPKALKHNETIYTWSVDPPSPYRPGSLQKKECRLIYGNFPFQSIASSDDAIMSFTDCHIISGNSGSPIFLARDNTMIGVAQAILSDAAKQELRLEDLEKHTMSFGSNLSCLENNLQSILKNQGACQKKFPYKAPPGLSEMNPETKAGVLRNFYAKYDSIMQETVRLLNNNDDDNIVWEYQEALVDNEKMTFSVHPKCRHDLTIDNQSEINVHIPTWTTQTYLKKDFTIGLRVESSQVIDSAVTLKVCQ